ncbi:siderophore-interacting protein [Nocardia sp. AG03]|uniref:siderophore-interacting protein n=1 Tax=Nocardia sp. AG03 TaxID=3025312 RepID=UPI0024188B93|nr:siderophore-interacting protein [Nocardia sp. AG03]
MPKPVSVTVVRKQWLTPHLVRVVGTVEPDGFRPNEFTDAYVKLIFPVPGVTYPEPFDLDTVRATLGPESQPILRTYTVRSFDPATGEIAIDFVVHGDDGVAGPWARDVEAGERFRLFGPGGAFAPDPAADWFLFAGDESALPAIAAGVAALPEGATAVVFVEVGGAEDEIALESPAELRLHWVHRGVSSDAVPNELAGANAPLVAAVRAAQWLPGQVQAFVHGEAEAVMRNLRPYLRKEREVAPKWLSISGYWRRGRTEEGFREWKRELAAEGA